MDRNSGTWAPPILYLAVDRYTEFKSWKAKWEDFTIVTEIANKPVAYQCAMLRYAFTDETRKIYETLNLTAHQQKAVTELISALEKFVKGIINETLERLSF